MSTAMVTPNTDWDNRELVQTLKDTVCKGATDSQFRMFIEVCKRTGLNPFLKEIWFVPSVGVMAGRDGYLRVANDHPAFDGMETLVERDDHGIPIKATCKVWRKDRAHPITCEAYYNEYKKDSQVWRTYKSAMISKVAEVLALKRSFSINGVVSEEEIGEQHEQGSKEAQAGVLQRKLAEIREAQAKAPEYPPANPATIIELADQLDAVEQQAPIEMPKPKKAKGGTINFDGLKKIGEMKTALRDLTGTDAQYYEVLKVAGVDHANELSTADGREVWKALAKIHKKLSADKSLREEIEGYALKIGPNKFAEVLGANGFEHIDQFISDANAEQITTTIKDLKNAALVLQSPPF